LAAAGVEVIGVGLAGRPDGPDVATRANWYAIDAHRRGRLASMGSRLPSMTFATTSLRGAVAALLAGSTWDAVIVDHLESGWVTEIVPEHGPPVVYVAHNHESSVRATVARESDDRVDRRAALRLDAAKARRLEQRLLRRAALVVAITESDAARFARDAPRASILVLTPGYRGIPLATRTIDEATPRQATIVTSLDWHVKQANLAAFVALADPVFAAADVTLAVAGGAPPELAARIQHTTRATTMLGRVDDLDPLLARTRIGVVAEPLGGGFKLKVLDYVFNRVPIAALAGSVEGVPLRPGTDILMFGDAAALARGVVAVIDDTARLNALQSNAFDQCRDAFDWATRGTAFAKALHRLSVDAR
jgi:glycosyltransferase involved in cell wall biosynthesis